MRRIGCFIVLFAGMIYALPAAAASISTVPIGDAGNPADSNGRGAVAYDFHIGATGVTNAQYVDFLNAVAASDPYGLYNTQMGSHTVGGIVRSGVDGSYTYAVKADAIGAGPGGSDYTYADKPVNYVSWYDAIRFANWLHNGQGGPGATEVGAYTLGAVDANGVPINGSAITRNPGAIWWLPSEDEWYKAAYYDPVAGVYHDYPTGTSIVPDNNLPVADTGNSANFLLNGNYTTGDPAYPMTDAGAYTLSASPYGTFDQAGSVWEWNEFEIASFRGLRGGSWNSGPAEFAAAFQTTDDPAFEGVTIGFRVAVVPEPGAILLGLCAGLALMLRPRRGSQGTTAGDLD